MHMSVDMSVGEADDAAAAHLGFKFLLLLLFTKQLLQGKRLQQQQVTISTEQKS